MTEHNSGTPLGAWLADLPDERLIRLLELRPDLTQPPPGSIAALAARAQSRQSVKAATDEQDFLRLAVLDALLTLHADTTPVELGKLTALIGGRAGDDAVAAALDDLRERALVWGDSEVRVAAEASAGLPWYPGQAVLEGADHTADEIAARLAAIDEPQRELLRAPDGGLAGGQDARRGARHPAGPARAAAARGGSTAAGRRRNRDPAAAGRSGVARRATRTGRV